jgi:hypothetical protein
MAHGSAAFTLTVYGHLFDADMDALADALDVSDAGRSRDGSATNDRAIRASPPKLRGCCSGGGTRTHNVRINSDAAGRRKSPIRDACVAQMLLNARVGESSVIGRAEVLNRCYEACSEMLTPNHETGRELRPSGSPGWSP